MTDRKKPGVVFSGDVVSISDFRTEESANEIVKFYGQQLRNGKILVVAEEEGPQAESKLAQAAAILVESATEPA